MRSTSSDKLMVDYYQIGLGAIAAPTYSEAVHSVLGTDIITQSGPKPTDRCGTCKFFQPIGDGEYGKCVLWSKMKRRPVRVHNTWFSGGYRPNMRVSRSLGGASVTQWSTETRPVFFGPAPWSKTGLYANNAVIQQAGRTVAHINVGDKHKTNIPRGAVIPFSDIHRITNAGEKDGVWTIEVDTVSNPEYYANLLQQTNFDLQYTVTPQILSMTPLTVDYEIEYTIAYDKKTPKSTGGPQRVRKVETVRDSNKVPAGRVVDLGGTISVEIDMPARLSSQTGVGYKIARRTTYRIRRSA